MKNPLRKRLFKEFKAEIGKYLVIFIFMAATIGLISGFTVASSSMKIAYDNSFEKYNVEWGHFTVGSELSDELVADIEKDNDVTMIKDYYKNLVTTPEADGKSPDDDTRTMRIYRSRDVMNKICIMDGRLAETDDEIALDRMYAVNNNIDIGDTITVAGKNFEVTGYTAFPDYSCLFEDNNDTMFDSVLFTVGITTESAYDKLDKSKEVYNYAWQYKKAPADNKAEKKLSDDFLEDIIQKIYTSGNNIDLYIPRYQNRAINFTGDDLGGDTVMMFTLLYIVMVIMAFVFAVTTNNTILKESTVIGTLRASGYKKSELLRHYMTLPVLVGLLACIVGNVLGYTCMKKVGESAYYGSYSLTTYVTKFNVTTFLATTVAPFAMLVIINALVISSKLKLSPLKMIRRDMGRSKRKKAVKLPHFKFMNRFRIRIIFQNISSYITLFAGIFFADVLLLFGLMMTPLLTHYQNEIVDGMICSNQYILAEPVDTSVEGAEKYAAASVVIDDDKQEEVTVYGIEPDSKYFKRDLSSSDILISEGYAKKYGIENGDTIKLKDEYEDGKYSFKVTGSYYYPSTISVFMPIDKFREVFDKDDDYYTGYFSNTELTDIDDKYVVSVIDEAAMTKASRQLERSMGNMFYLFNVFSVILFALLVYLLTKIIIEKNTNSISMTKILGYTNREINGLYMTANVWVVIFSSIIGIIISALTIKPIFSAMMANYVSGYMDCYIAPYIYPLMLAISLVVFFLVQLTQMKKIKSIPMDEALKNVE